MNSKTKKLVMAALFAAIACVATAVLVIPIPSTGGYLNMGDAVVLFGAFALGPVWGAAAGGIGSAMADVLLGYTAYAPGTLVIKGLTALAAGWLFQKMQRLGTVKTAVLSGIVGECIMVLGYFLYESTLLGYGMAAAASIPANSMQGLVGLVIGAVLAKSVLRRKQLI